MYKNNLCLKYIFIGNRFFVLSKMLELGCIIVKIFAIKNSFLAKRLDSENIDYDMLPDKNKLFSLLEIIGYDILISNGCPYILPISLLQNGCKKFINIHPSLLPDLKGKSPINGALLFHRKHGVTCHYMNDKVDDGEIISQIEIPITPDLNLDLLYQVSFRTEGEVFEQAFVRNFEKNGKSCSGDFLYYSRNEQDMLLSKNDSVETLFRKVKAFETRGQYAKIQHRGSLLAVCDAVVIENEYVNRLYKDSSENIVLLIYGTNKVLVKLQGALLSLCLSEIEGLAEQALLIDS